MADAKEEKKGLTIFEEVMILLFLLYVAGVLLWRANVLLVYYKGETFGSIWNGIITFFYNSVVPVFKVIAIILAAVAAWGIVVASRNLSKIEKEEKEIYGAKLPQENEPAPVYKNERWERVITHLNSVNSSDWRLAVLEADIMLDELLKTLGYHGESLGERLKSVEKSDMLTLDNAWEAHRIRNQIAHQGADYPLSEREAKRAIALYESVFKEYKII